MSKLNQVKFYIAEDIEKAVIERLKQWDADNIASGVWAKNPKIWKEKQEDDKELSNRLGWLDLAYTMKDHVAELTGFAEEVKTEFTEVVLLGMGGSSLAPEVFSKTFGHKEGCPRLTILDSTHPLSVGAILEKYDLKKTLFVVSSKSGGTIETMSFFHTFFNEVKKFNSNPGAQFIALTDPGSGLEQMAKKEGFKKIFSTPPEVGGRFSALTAFGMVPAALIGMNVEKFILEAAAMTDACSAKSLPSDSAGFQLGALAGELALRGIDKFTFFASKEIASFTSWVEQLIAESTGKEGKGILPVAGEDFGDIKVYGKDRFFVYLKLAGSENSKNDEAIKQLIEKGFAVMVTEVPDKYALAQEFYRWEAATALAGVVLKINPFNQPNVQLAKTLAGESLAQYKANGSLPVQKPVIVEDSLELFTETGAASIKAAVEKFLSQAKQGSYVAINSFVPMTKEAEESLSKFRMAIRDKYHVATTLGFGPRFLHSTGQLHKGDGNNGLFIIITTEAGKDVEVPGQGYSFGTLIAAQGQGDQKALINTGRKTLHIGVKPDSFKAIEELL